ncbi:MAG TPA: penicillin-binding protein activator [Pedomonas sp.]|uniref:penicillin-binding protein activator n=1 Tax=Pedomonas sp. TaxID=2976421 RepID=UPI002F4245D4
MMFNLRMANLRVGSIAAAFGLLTVAGCASQNGTVRAPAPAPVAPAQPEVTAPQQPEVVKPGPAQHHVALLVPMTGPNAPIGQSIANAANMALLDINNPQIRLRVYNTTDGAGKAASDAVADGARIILGPLLADDVKAVQPVAEFRGVPVVTFSNDASLAGSGTYVLGYQPDQEIERVVSHARRQGMKRFAALIPSGSYGKRASEAFVEAVRDAGGSVVSIETYPRDRARLLTAARRVANYDARLAKARAQAAEATGVVGSAASQMPPVNFDTLLIADVADYARAFVPALKQYGVDTSKVRILGPGLWNTEQNVGRGGTLAGAWFASVPDHTYNSLAQRYASRFGSRPSRFASMGYDSILLVHAATASGWKIGTPFPRTILHATAGYTGIDGLFRFDDKGVAERGMQVNEVTATGSRVAAPAPTAFPTELVN